MVKVLKLNESLKVEQSVVLAGHKGVVRTVQFGYDDTILYSAGGVEFGVKVWDV